MKPWLDDGDVVEREARHDWLNERDLLREPVDVSWCRVCGEDECECACEDDE